MKHNTAQFAGKTLLVTGGTGSFGQKFTEIVLQQHNPREIRVFSRGELLQVEMQRKFQDDKRLHFFIGDVRDIRRHSRVMRGVDIVVHAAALKQVPVCEENPRVAVDTNIEGVINVIASSINHDVEKVIAISSDKACHPINTYGATKMIMEKIMVQSNTSSKHIPYTHPIFSCVRYGNVVGSRGSVIPLFLEQKKSGKAITITDERMTRFWITLEQGVQFVIDCLGRMRGGEIFIPKLPSMRILDLLSVIAPEVEHKVTGIRPGEKLHEELLSEEEARHSRTLGDYFTIIPEFPYWKADKGYPKLKEGFRYSSDTNEWWLTKEEIRGMIDNVL